MRPLNMEYNRTTRVGSLIRRALVMFLCFYTLDPFSVYRNDYKNKSMHYRHHNKAHFRQNSQDNFGKLKHKTRTIFLFILVYWLLKYGCLVLGEHIQLSPAAKESQLLGWFVNFVQTYIGNPFHGAYGDVTTYFYWSMNLCLVHTMFLVPRYYARHPMDSVGVRVLLEPRRELRRIDAAINEKVQHIRRHTRLSLHLESADLSSLRPPIYHLKWEEPLMSRLLLAYWVYFVGSFPGIISMIPFVVYQAELSRCGASMSLSACRVFEEFTWPQLVTILELSLAISFISLFAMLQLFVGTIGTINHLWLALNMRRDMERCLEKLRLYNYFISRPRYIRSERQVDEDLLKTYIRLYMNNYELSRGARFLTEAFTAVGAVYGIAGVFVLVVATSQRSELQYVSRSLFAFLWVVTNVVVTICAYTFARTVEAEKVGASLLAQLTLRNEWRKQFIKMDFIHMSWVKLICGNSLDDSKKAIRSLNVKLTYKTLLTFNLGVTSIVALLSR